MVPVTAVIAIPLLYAAWLRRKALRAELHDPLRLVPRQIRRAAIAKDAATVVYLVSFAAAATIGALGGSGLYWTPLAGIAVAAFVVRVRMDNQIRQWLESEKSNIEPP